MKIKREEITGAHLKHLRTKVWKISQAKLAKIMGYAGAQSISQLERQGDRVLLPAQRLWIAACAKFGLEWLA